MNSSLNFFDQCWKQYLEYEAALGFGLRQQQEEIRELAIKSGDAVANIGINWGHSLNLIFQSCPSVQKVVGVDSSKEMLAISQLIFSQDETKIKELARKLSPVGGKYILKLHQQIQPYRERTSFLFLAAEELDTSKMIFDKIAATMGYHWLQEPQEEAFTSFNRSLRLDGQLTFSTASAYFETNLHLYSFTANPFYQKFLEEFELRREQKGIPPRENFLRNHTFSREEIMSTIERSGFILDNYREHCSPVPEQIIDKVCLAVLWLRYDISGREKEAGGLFSESFQRARREYRYEDHRQQLEICPIFKIRKVKEV